MLVKQVSIFVENKEGKIAEILDILGGNGINIKALSLADTTNFGILRIIVNDPFRAIEILKEKDVIVKVTDVVAVKVTDEPGGLASILMVLSEHNMQIEYMYAFIGDNDSKAMVVLKIDDAERAVRILKENKTSLVYAEDINQKL